MQSPIKKPLSPGWNIFGLIVAWISPLSYPLAIWIALSYLGTLGYGDFVDSLRDPALILCLMTPYFGFTLSLLLCLQNSWKMKLAAIIPLITNFIISAYITAGLFMMFLHFLQKNLW